MRNIIYIKGRLLKAAAILMAAILMFTSLVGCGDDIISSDKVDTEIFQALYAANQAMVSSANSSVNIAYYLESWARGNDKFKVSHDKYDNIIVSTTATPGYEDADSTILHCTLESDAPERTSLAITAIMYLMEYSTNHGFIRAIFAEPSCGIETVKENYLRADNFISFDWSKNNNIMIGSAGKNCFHVQKEITYEAPSFPDAYRITIMGLEPTMAAKTNQINAVKTIGKLLAELKSSGTLIEIAEFNSGYMNNEGLFVADEFASDDYPLGASALVLVNDNDVSKLTKKIEKSRDKMLEKYEETDPNMFYEITPLEETSGITQVLSPDDTSTLLSFIYTCPCGTYEKDDEGEVTSLTNILSCNTQGGKMCFNLCAIAQEESKLSSLNHLFLTLSGLYELECTMEEDSPVWPMLLDPETIDENDYAAYEALTPLMRKLAEISTEVYEKDTSYGFGFDNTSTAKLLKRLPDANVATYGLTEKNIERQLETVLTFLERINTK